MPSDRMEPQFDWWLAGTVAVVLLGGALFGWWVAP